ncbi:MAG: hypothetical protein R6W31_10745 [Bacteroidales bacterium]
MTTKKVLSKDTEHAESVEETKDLQPREIPQTPSAESPPAPSENQARLEMEKFLPFRLQRHFSKDGTSPFDEIRYQNRSCRIMNSDGSVVFAMDNAEIPENWTQLASDILISKYFRKAGVPGAMGRRKR